MTRLLVSLFVLASAPALAQVETVPADLFYAVHRVSDPGAVTVGDAPPELVALFPEGAEVVGALGWSGPDDDDGATAIGRVDAEPEALTRAYDLDPPEGWQLHAWAGQMSRGGLMATAIGDEVVLCREGAGAEAPVFIDVRPRPTGGAFVVARSGGWSQLRCDGTRAEFPARFPNSPSFRVEISDLPALQPPPGARVRTQGGGGGNDDAHQDATLTWDGTAGAALAHYGAQLEAAGWTQLAAGDRDGAASATWTTAADDGPRAVTLTAIRTAPDTYALRLALASYGD